MGLPYQRGRIGECRKEHEPAKGADLPGAGDQHGNTRGVGVEDLEPTEADLAVRFGDEGEPVDARQEPRPASPPGFAQERASAEESPGHPRAAPEYDPLVISVGLAAVSSLLGIDERGRQILSFIEGLVPDNLNPG